MAWGARWRVGDNVEVESGYGDAVFMEALVRPFLPLIPVLSEGSEQRGEASQSPSSQGMLPQEGQEREPPDAPVPEVEG
jgi:hypothetical protein